MTQVELAVFQISRRALPWLLTAVVAATLPHAGHLPPWLLAMSALCVGWRWAVHRGRLAYPPARVQFLFALAVVAGVFLHYRTLAGHEAGTALLIAMFSLKLLEMYRERDAYVVILLGYFVAATAFLFFFELAMAAYVLGVALLFTAALTAINAGSNTPRFEPIKRASWLLLQSIPLALVLFVVMPRIGALWSIGLAPTESTSGIGDTLTPGSIGKLVLSDALAFRVDFVGVPPPPSQLYWRGLTLSEFDGRTWRQTPDIARYPSLTWFAGRTPAPWAERLAQTMAAAPRERLLQYTLMLEPTQQPWLFALLVPRPEQPDAGLVFDHRLLAAGPVKTLKRYQVTSVAGVLRDVEPPPWLLADNLRLPGNANPQSRLWAVQMRAAAGSDAAFAKRVVAMFRDEGFVYTLAPPLLGQHAVDEFLFGSKRGFCENYASSFVFLMRAAGIPARVVVGYQGGEFNPLGNTVQVRQYDAHAWAEIWLPEKGWVEFDPTAVVAPERISSGSGESIPGRSKPGFSALAGTMFGGSLAVLGDAVDFLNHNWNKWVIGFDERAQQGFLRQWLGSLSPYRIGLFVLGSGAVVVTVLLLWMFRGSLFVKVDPVTREYRRFCAAWAARGHARRDDEGPYDYAQRLRTAEPQRANAVQRFIVLYAQLVYAGKPVNGAALRVLRKTRGWAT